MTISPSRTSVVFSGADRDLLIPVPELATGPGSDVNRSQTWMAEGV
jgi:hypothetical protein